MKAYFAGPDVFYPDAAKRTEALRETARKYGVTALCPVDNEIPEMPPKQMSKAIFDANVAMIDAADAVVANLTPFRGPSADAGTIWEVGNAIGRGKPVYAWTEQLTEYKTRVTPDDYMVEDFGGFDNLMISESVHIFSSLDEALAAMTNQKSHE